MEGGGEANEGGGSDVVTINIRFSACKKIVVHVSLDSSVESLKSVIAKNSDVRVEEQRLINNGRLLKDDRTLRSYGILLSSSPYWFYICMMFTCLLNRIEIVIAI